METKFQKFVTQFWSNLAVRSAFDVFIIIYLFIYFFDSFRKCVSIRTDTELGPRRGGGKRGRATLLLTNVINAE